ncbi:arf-GAP with Rho-GAP domain, ANK repeat and PH domain-containing protein 2 isoform X1 [Danaus plexippus]|uniref:arf-GAP with Rho-GAP domain, ANK repeat and PH domain-containing protein 2 isoform X1 n=2 Tax=Danaus plexippus TaxID=13037 RepID=UPI002AB31A2B|nr:arf-GAP with Rho-GAP domain, ANK repeat and PH domain-containing protein 2 isoform X1 [Danaus plexippus]
MDTPPVPKPRVTHLPQNEVKRPIPLPRTKPPVNNERVTATDIFRSISSVSKQITEDVAQKVSNSAKCANEKIEKSISDGSKFAKGTLEKTMSTSRAVRDSVTKSVIEGTKSAGLKLRLSKRVGSPEEEDSQRCVSMPVVDVSLFDNIQFHSPLLEQKRFKNDDDSCTKNQLPSLQLNATHLDDVSLYSTFSDSNTDSMSNLSYDVKEIEGTELPIHYDTYDTPQSSRANSVISTTSAPEVPERRHKRNSHIEIMRQNSLYENWTLPFTLTSETKPETVTRPSKSTIYEFDPLNNNSDNAKRYEGVSNELLLLESFLIGDTYGTIISTDSGNDEPIYDFGESDYFNPPTPPERSDSLLPNEPLAKSSSSSSEKEKLSNWYVGTDPSSTETVQEDIKPSSSMIQKFSSMLKLDNKLSKSNSKSSVQKIHVIERPPLNKYPVPYYSGTLTKVVSGLVEDLFKNSQSRYCVLSDQKLICYTDPANLIMKEAYTLDNILSLQIVLPLSSSTSNNSYCFELTVSTGLRNAPRKILFNCGSASERRNWAQKIAEHLTSGIPIKYSSEYTRCGWCYLKEGVSGAWCGAWVMLVRRVLVYCYKEDEIHTVDLRKTRCIATQEADEETKNSCPSDNSPNLLLDCPHVTLYLRFPHERELKGWKYMVKLSAHNNGSHIHHQQLTKEDVPVIVDKCLSFIYAHGSLSEGIYRRAGSSSVLTELLSRFRRDSWSVQLTPGTHSEHDVAGVLKRFFRDLPQSLVPKENHAELIAALDLDKEARMLEYRRLMTSLPLVPQRTARKLFAHLHCLHTMSRVNKMCASNLASVWAPTIMPTALTSQSLQTAWSAKEQYVVKDLITHYEAVWDPSESERRREAVIRKMLSKAMNNTVPLQPKSAGDLRAWVYVHNRDTCYQVELTPNKTSGTVCIELCEKAKMDSHLLMVEEVICNGSMRRIVHIDEVILDVVLRWGYWDEDDRKDNYLLVKENKILHELESLRHSTSLVCGELRIANETTKSFKLHMFECSNSKLCYFKDKQGSHKIEEWNIKDLLWYVGHEPKRNPQSRWAITFIPRNNKQKRSKDRPWFGCTIAGAVTEDQLKWMTAMTFGEHANILPTPRLVIT